MIFPYSTDAPIYHLPFATVGLIVVTFGIFFACAQRAAEISTEPDDNLVAVLLEEESQIDLYAVVVDPWILHYGQLNPVQWVTSNFMHANFLHVFGNMAGLWGLGLIVEGKVGWWRFLLMYLGIGAVQSGIEQLLMLPATTGGSLGASAIIYGMLVIAMLWAPKNELNCLMWLRFRPFVFDLSVLVYALILLGLELVLGLLANFSFGSTILHLMGAAVGLVVGVAMLKLHWVDCEGFDALSLWFRDHRNAATPPPEPREVVTPEQIMQRRQLALSQIQQLIVAGQVQLALVAHQRTANEIHDWQLPAATHLQLIAALQKEQMWSQSLPLMLDYLQRHDEKATQVRLQLAKLLIEQENRPAQALKVLAKINPRQCDERLEKICTQLKHKAAALVAEGEVEVATEDW